MKPMFSKKKSASDADGADGAPSLTTEQLWSRLLAWQARRDHSRVELTRKLQQLGAEPDVTDALLVRLGELGLQDDDRYAGALVRSQLVRGRGLQSLRQQLRDKGLATDHPALEAETADIDWTERARSLVQRRLGSRSLTDPREQARQLRFLVYRGFSQAQAMQAVRLILVQQRAESALHPDD